MKLKDKQNLVLVFLGLFLVLVTWIFLWPKTKEVLGSKNTLDTQTQRWKNLGVKLTELQGLNESELSEQTGISLRAIPAEKRFLEVLGRLSGMANAQGLTLESFQVSPGNLSSDKESKLEFKISLAGNSTDLGKFLAAAEKNLPLVDIKKVKVSTKEGISEIELEFDSFFLSLPTTLGSLETALPKLSSAEQQALQTLSEFGFAADEESFSPSPTGRSNPFTF